MAAPVATESFTNTIATEAKVRHWKASLSRGRSPRKDDVLGRKIDLVPCFPPFRIEVTEWEQRLQDRLCVNRLKYAVKFPRATRLFGARLVSRDYDVGKLSRLKKP